jgi:hypothetical protein
MIGEMPQKPGGPYPHAAELACYERLVATQPGVERKGATLPYTSANGNMFSYLDASGTLALRLSPTDRLAFLARYDARLMVAHGRQQLEYVAVSAPLLERTDELEPWFARSLAFATALKPKRSRRT